MPTADGFANEDSTEASCEIPSGYLAEPDDGLWDCDDGDSTIYPGADEIWYDGEDQDCDEDTEYDADGDGFDSAAYGGDDCYDLQSEIDAFFTTSGTTDIYELTPELCFPASADADGAEEGWYDGLDQDLRGRRRLRRRRRRVHLGGRGPHGPGARTASTLPASSRPCSRPRSRTTPTSSSPEDINPDATVDYSYDGIDQDCNGRERVRRRRRRLHQLALRRVPTASTPRTTSPRFSSRRAWTRPTSTRAWTRSARPMRRSTPTATATSTPDNGLPIDDGTIASYLDEDGDGFGDESNVVYLCETSDDYSSSFGDCDDANGEVYPGATEKCNNEDDDCDDLVDEPAEGEDAEDLVGCIDLYADRDGDGYGSTADGDKACMCFDGTSVECGEGYEYNPNSGLCYSKEAGDCYDYDPTIKPRAETDTDDPDYVPLVELIDGDDNDCNGRDPHHRGRLRRRRLDADVAPVVCPRPTRSPAPKTSACPTAGGRTGSRTCCAARPTPAPRQTCDDIDLQSIVTCWGASDLRPTCDEETGLAVVSLQADGVVERFDGGKRLWTSEDSEPFWAGETWGDCDDLCPYRSPDLDEQCDGIDNDCNGASGTIVDTDRDGLPDSMEEDITVPGYVTASRARSRWRRLPGLWRRRVRAPGAGPVLPHRGVVRRQRECAARR